jgi:hypothetical protein
MGQIIEASIDRVKGLPARQPPIMSSPGQAMV